MAKGRKIGAGALRTVRRFFPEVTSVSDADDNVEIEVTGADTRAADRRKHKTCAMAVACKRKMHADGVIISVKTAYLVRNKKATRYTLPDSVSREIVSFDRHGDFAEGTYQLSKPPKGARLGTPGGHTSHTGNGPKRARLRHFTSGIRTVLGGSGFDKKAVEAE